MSVHIKCSALSSLALRCMVSELLGNAADPQFHPEENMEVPPRFGVPEITTLRSTVAFFVSPLHLLHSPPKMQGVQ